MSFASITVRSAGRTDTQDYRWSFPPEEGIRPADPDFTRAARDLVDEQNPAVLLVRRGGRLGLLVQGADANRLDAHGRPIRVDVLREWSGDDAAGRRLAAAAVEALGEPTGGMPFGTLGERIAAAVPAAENAAGFAVDWAALRGLEGRVSTASAGEAAPDVREDICWVATTSPPRCGELARTLASSPLPAGDGPIVVVGTDKSPSDIADAGLCYCLTTHPDATGGWSAVKKKVGWPLTGHRMGPTALTAARRLIARNPQPVVLLACCMLVFSVWSLSPTRPRERRSAARSGTDSAGESGRSGGGAVVERPGGDVVSDPVGPKTEPGPPKPDPVPVRRVPLEAPRPERHPPADGTGT